MTDSGTILKTVNQEIEDFKTKRIQIVPGLTFNQYETINNIYYYYNSKFTSGEIDEEGNRKYFYNIVKNPCKVFSKAIDFDTKNIRLLTADGGDSLKTWFMERDLKYWMKDKQFGKVLNRIFKELPIFGSVVLKIVDGYPMFVDLRNFIVEPSADSLDGANFVTEIHNYTVPDFRAAAKQMGWEKSKVDEAIREFRKMKNSSHLRVFERYGELADQDETGEITYTYSRLFIADVGVDTYDQYGNLTIAKPGVILGKEGWDGTPYWEFHAEKLSGRWLGIGVVETLIEPQIRQNEIANLQAKGSYWSALRVFQTRDQAVNRNMMSDVRNGEILNVDSEITPVNMDDRNLAFFTQETQKWLANRDELTFSYDVVQGERLPAGTPLGSAQLATAQTLSYFEQIQENVALDVKEMLFQVIIPNFEKEATPEHTLRLVGQDLDEYAKLIKNALVLKEMMRQAVRSLQTGHFPTEQDKETAEIAIEQTIKQGKERLVTIPKGFYKDLKYDVDIDITGESVDTRVRAATKFAILQAMTADPTITQDPTKKKILTSYAEDGGINPNDLFEETEDDASMKMAMMTGGRAGGGVSAPDLSTPVPGQSGMTV
jgi:hypothetical protein